MAAAAPPPSFKTAAEAKSAMATMVELLSTNRADLLKKLEGQDTQQKKIAAVMPAMQALLAPEMQKLGFPAGPMGLMMGFAAFKKASTELEGCAVIQKGERVAANVYLSTCAFSLTFAFSPSPVTSTAIDMLQAAMMSGAVKDEAEIIALVAELKA